MPARSAVAPLAGLALAFCASCASVSCSGGTDYETAINRHVTINITSDDGEGNCSGVIIQTGIVLTANHCRGDVMVVDGQTARVLAASEEPDLLLLAVNTRKALPIVVGTMPSIGQPVHVVANYAGWRALTSTGTVMAVREGDVWASVAAGPGFSGSALYSASGAMVGINTQARGWIDADRVPQILYGFAIGPHKISQFLRANRAKIEGGANGNRTMEGNPGPGP